MEGEERKKHLTYPFTKYGSSQCKQECSPWEDGQECPPRHTRMANTARATSQSQKCCTVNMTPLWVLYPDGAIIKFFSFVLSFYNNHVLLFNNEKSFSLINANARAKSCMRSLPLYKTDGFHNLSSDEKTITNAMRPNTPSMSAGTKGTNGAPGLTMGGAHIWMQS